MKILAITCTGGRPEAFKLCKFFMGRQTHRPDTWLIIDDCMPRTAVPQHEDWIKLVHPMWLWQRKTNTIHANLTLALEMSLEIDHDVAMLFEDDDWYAPNYIEFMAENANGGMVGLSKSHDYNVRFRSFRYNHNRHHCTGASTTWGREVTPRLLEILAGDKRAALDRIMWARTRMFKQSLIPEYFFTGIKGLPGRPGTVRTHRKGHLLEPDPEMAKLKEWIGDDWKLYEKFGNLS